MELTSITGDSVTVSDAVFGGEFREPLVHQIVTAYMAASRSGTKGQKNRSAVSGGGAKPFRQKGTGRARAGTIRSPLWRGGGVTFAATNRDFTQKVNRKQYRAGMRSILAELVRQERLIVGDLSVTEPKTKAMKAKVADIDAKRLLIVCDEVTESTYLASRNIPYLNVCDVAAVDPVSLVAHDKVVISASALQALEARLS